MLKMPVDVGLHAYIHYITLHMREREREKEESERGAHTHSDKGGGEDVYIVRTSIIWLLAFDIWHLWGVVQTCMGWV